MNRRRIFNDNCFVFIISFDFNKIKTLRVGRKPMGLCRHSSIHLLFFHLNNLTFPWQQVLWQFLHNQENHEELFFDTITPAKPLSTFLSSEFSNAKTGHTLAMKKITSFVWYSCIRLACIHCISHTFYENERYFVFLEHGVYGSSNWMSEVQFLWKHLKTFFLHVNSALVRIKQSHAIPTCKTSVHKMSHVGTLVVVMKTIKVK